MSVPEQIIHALGKEKPIVKTERGSGARSEITVIEFFEQVRPHFADVERALDIVTKERRAVEIPEAVYTLNADWLMSGEVTEEVGGAEVTEYPC